MSFFHSLSRFSILLSCVVTLTACSSENETAVSDKAQQEDPAEKGAAEIERKADDTVKAKIKALEEQQARSAEVQAQIESARPDMADDKGDAEKKDGKAAVEKSKK